MQTAAQVEAAFRADLQTLLDKYDAELVASDFFTGYAECGEDIRIEVTIQGIYDAAHNCIREFTVFDLGKGCYPSRGEE